MKKLLNNILYVLISVAYMVSLILCAIGKIVFIIPIALSYFCNEDIAPKWTRELDEKLGRLYDEHINLRSGL